MNAVRRLSSYIHISSRDMDVELATSPATRGWHRIPFSLIQCNNSSNLHVLFVSVIILDLGGWGFADIFLLVC